MKTRLTARSDASTVGGMPACRLPDALLLVTLNMVLASRRRGRREGGGKREKVGDEGRKIDTITAVACIAFARHRLTARVLQGHVTAKDARTHTARPSRVASPGRHRNQRGVTGDKRSYGR